MRERVSVPNRHTYIVIGSHLIYHDDQTQGEGRHHEGEGECTQIHRPHLYCYRQSVNLYHYGHNFIYRYEYKL